MKNKCIPDVDVNGIIECACQAPHICRTCTHQSMDQKCTHTVRGKVLRQLIKSYGEYDTCGHWKLTGRKIYDVIPGSYTVYIRNQCDSCRVIKMFDEALNNDGHNIFVDSADPNASDDNDGLSVNRPVKTMANAIVKSRNGGMICIARRHGSHI